MLYHWIISLISFNTLGLLECTPQVEWTMYTHSKSWNEGQMVCWTLGGRLASPDTADDKTAMDYFINNEPWKSNAGSLTLFMDMGDVAEGGVKWNDCSDVFNIWTNSFDSTPDGCAGVLPSKFSQSQKISTAACYDQKRRYICEVEVSPTCPYETAVGQPSSLVGDIHGTLASDVECQQQCTGDATCRAYSFDTKCSTFSDSNSMVFEGGANINNGKPGETHYKNCYLSAMVEGDPEVTSPTSFTPFPYDCGSQDPAAIVYTALSDSVTWTLARGACSVFGASIAVLDTDIKVEVVSTLLNDSTLGYHWVGYQKVADDSPQWLTGGNLFNVTPADPPTSAYASCGTTDLWTGEHRLHDCQTKLSYVCQHTAGHCHYVVTSGQSATEGYTDHGAISMSECYDICDADRQNANGGFGCYAFITHYPDASQGKLCRTLNFASWEQSFMTADSWIIEDPDTSLWRFTCITVVVNNYTKIVQNEGSIVTASPTTTTLTDATTFISTQSSSLSSTSSSSAASYTTSSPSSSSSSSLTSLPTTALALQTTPISTITSTAEVTSETTMTTTTTNPSTDNSASNLTNTSLPTPTTGGLNLCRCPCHSNLSTVDPNKFQEELASLHVPVDSTGSAYRKKNSIMDDRPTSNGMGTVACVFLSCVLGTVIAFDVINLCASRKRSMRY